MLHLKEGVLAPRRRAGSTGARSGCFAGPTDRCVSGCVRVVQGEDGIHNPVMGSRELTGSSRPVAHLGGNL